MSHSEDSLARGTGGSQQSSPKTSREISVREIYCSSYVCSIRIDDDAPSLWRRLASSLSLAKGLQIVGFFLPASQYPSRVAEGIEPWFKSAHALPAEPEVLCAHHVRVHQKHPEKIDAQIRFRTRQVASAPYVLMMMLGSNSPEAMELCHKAMVCEPLLSIQSP